MGTNFYFLTKEKEQALKWFKRDELELIDEPFFGYQIHLAKTSCGWLPLFQAYQNVNSVADLKKIYDDGGFSIVDEYGELFDWGLFRQKSFTV